MATTTITITISTPAGVTVADAIKYYSDWNSYPTFMPDGITPNSETRAAFSQRKISEHIALAIRQRRLQEAKDAVALPNEITVV